MPEDQEQMTEDLSNYRETEQSVRGLRTYHEANSIRELTERALKHNHRDDDYLLRVRERSDGLFDMVVLHRVN